MSDQLQQSRTAERAAAKTRADIRACIFDLDGTLIDSEPVYRASDTAFLASYGVDYDDDFYHSVMGRGTGEFIEVVKSRFPQSPLNSLGPSEALKLKDAAYLAYAKGRTKAFPSMKQTALDLAARGCPRAIASGSSPHVIRAVLAEAGLENIFPVIVSAAEMARGKPEPDIFLEAARRLGVEPGCCLVFEDSRSGILAAAAAHMPCFLFPEKGMSDPSFSLATKIFPGGARLAAAEDIEDAIREFAPRLLGQ